MNILLASSEAVPFAKTGGLADVSGALPVELARLGHQAAVIMPAYRQTRYCGQPIEPLGLEFIVPVGSKMVSGQLSRSFMPGGKVPVYLVHQDQYFDRDQLYGVDGKDYIDNCERFVFFSRAVLEAIRLLDLHVDILHANDWQTGLVPAYLKIIYAAIPHYQKIASVFALHNMAYQGMFWHWDMLLTGLDWKYFNWHQMEFHNNLSLLKTGMVFSDSIVTVSPRYAQEIQSSPLGCGLEGVLQYRRDVLSGILNGIDEVEWNPATDRHLPMQYDVTTVSRGKAACKAALQKELGLPQVRRRAVGRRGGPVGDQKGHDLIAEVMQRWVQTSDVQWVILGTGQPKYHKLLRGPCPAIPEQGRRAAGVLQSLGPSHRGRQRHVPHAQPLRALRIEPDVQPEIRHDADCPRDGRAGRHDRRLRQPAGRIRAGQRIQFPGVQSLGLERDPPPGLRPVPLAPGRVEEAARNRHAAGLVLAAEREEVRRAVPEDGDPGRGGGNGREVTGDGIGNLNDE